MFPGVAETFPAVTGQHWPSEGSRIRNEEEEGSGESNIVSRFELRKDRKGPEFWSLIDLLKAFQL